MSVSTSDEWVCDRCGRKSLMYHGTSGSRDQPPGWAAIWTVKPPLKNPTESDERPDQVCVDCVRDFSKWFSQGRDRAVLSDG